MFVVIMHNFRNEVSVPISILRFMKIVLATAKSHIVVQNDRLA